MSGGGSYLPYHDAATTDHHSLLRVTLDKDRCADEYRIFCFPVFLHSYGNTVRKLLAQLLEAGFAHELGNEEAHRCSRDVILGIQSRTRREAVEDRGSKLSDAHVMRRARFYNRVPRSVLLGLGPDLRDTRPVRPVDLVQAQDARGTCESAPFTGMLNAAGVADIYDVHHDICIDGRTFGLLTHSLLKQISRLQQPRGVDEDGLMVLICIDRQQSLPGGLGFRGHDRQALSDQSLYQSRLADVRQPDHGDKARPEPVGLTASLASGTILIDHGAKLAVHESADKAELTGAGRTAPREGRRMIATDTDRNGGRPLLVAAALLGAVIVLWLTVRWLATAGVPYMNDFVAYWAVGRLLLEGGNPYAVEAILELQRSVGSRFIEAGVVRNPPWTLPLLLPFAALEFAVGWFAWALLQIALVGACAAVLWRLFDGRARPAVAIGLTFAFPPALFVALGGQIGGLLLLGLTGFTWAIIRRKDFLAGLFLALLTLKPHILLPFGIAVLLWSMKERRLRPLAGAAIGVAAGSLVALSLQPEIFSQYLDFARVQVPEEDLVSTPGASLRLLLGFDRFWIQWVPTAAGIGWVFLHYSRRAENWDWRSEMPLLGAVSWLAAPYGWVYDMVILVPTILDAAIRIEATGDRRLARRALTGYLLFGVTVWSQHLAFGSGVIHAWVGPAVLLAWLWVRVRTDGRHLDAAKAKGREAG